MGQVIYGSDEWVFNQLSADDRAEIASQCFQDGIFLEGGALVCLHGGGQGCVEEFWCECFAAWLLMPTNTFEADDWMDDARLSRRYMVELWAVRFRRILAGWR